MTIRLNKVTRDLNVGIATVVDFLQKKGYTIEANPNTKITDEQYAALVKEFSKDKDLKIESEKIFQERQNKERNKASVSIDDLQAEAKPEVIETVVPEDARPKFKPVGKIDLDSLNKKKVKPAVVEPAKEEIKEVVEESVPVEKNEPQHVEETPVAETVQPQPQINEQQKQPEQEKAEDLKPDLMEEKKEVPEVQTVLQDKEDEVFKIRPTEFKSKINVVGQIDLAALNQSTRPKKKTKEEKRKEREEKDKLRQEQRKQMKDAIIKEIRKTDEKTDKGGQSDASGKKKRNRINKERVDINAAGNIVSPRGDKGGKANSNAAAQGGGKHNKDRFKKPVVKPEVSDEDVAKQVKETLARLTNKGKNKAAKYRKEKRESIQNRQLEQEELEQEESKILKLTEFVTANELANMMDISVTQVISTCMSVGIMVSINQRLDAETINLVAEEFGYKTEYVSAEVAQAIEEEADAEEDLQPRAPIVTVMGHVDHGKTSLLDYIRKANVIAGEAGGITQHIGAYNVKLEDGRRITFLDTPGHEAFTAMRLRGAKSTDIAILVVAADDGVMPQTIEAINHAKAAGIDIVVAVNKIDKPSANVERVKQELTEYDLIAEDWGGSTIFCPVSAHTGEGIDNLLEMLLLTAEMRELKANPNRKARGLVIEAKLDKGRGPVATILVQKGTLHVGDFIAVGPCHGKVRAMIDDKGRRINEAGPSTPVEIIGLNDVPNAGDIFISPKTDKEAKTFAETFIAEGKNRLVEETKSKMSLEDLFSQIQAGNLKELDIIVKADVQGSVEAVKQSLVKLSNDEVIVKVIHAGVGAINESDVILASASNAIIIGFNVRPDNQARDIAERENVDLRLYRVIYQAIEDVEAAMKGMLDPKYEEKVIGTVEVRQTYKASVIGTIAGSYVLDGMVTKNSSVRVTRGDDLIYDGPIASLKRFKDDVKEVKAGYECGIVLEKFNDIKEGDMMEVYTMVEIPR